MKIKVSKYNEVGKAEVERLAKMGARIIKAPVRFGFKGVYVTSVDGEVVRAGDDIIINNVILTVAHAEDDYFDREIEIQ